MNGNQSPMKILDGLIDYAIKANLYIDYIAIGPKLMSILAEEITLLVDPENDMGLMIQSLSSYRDMKIREIEAEGITVKYLLNQEEWIPLG